MNNPCPFDVQALESRVHLSADLFTRGFKGSTADVAADAALQPDGKVILVGNHVLRDFGVARFTSIGQIDRSFGVDGKVVTDIAGGFDRAFAVAVAPNGTIYVAGSADHQLAVAAYRPNGTPHPAFGDDGKVRFDEISAWADGEARVLPNGKLLISANGRVVRLNADGTLDATLATFGGFDDEDVHMLPDGRFVAAYWVSVAEWDPDEQRTVSTVALQVSRFNADGSPDVAFGAGGHLSFARSDQRFVASPRVMAHGEGIVLAGGFGNGSDAKVIRLDAAGNLDGSFGNGGVVLLEFVKEIAPLAMGPDGRIFVTTTSYRGAFEYGEIVTRALTADGKLDPSFSGDGVATPRLPGDAQRRVAAVLPRPDGRVVVAGSVQHRDGRDFDFGVIRYDADGTFNTNFGAGGLGRADFVGATTDVGRVLASYPDGATLVAGKSGDVLALLRYRPDGTPDRSFGVRGVVRTTLLDDPVAVAIQPDGKILISLESPYPPTLRRDRFTVARFDHRGMLDTNFGTRGIAAIRGRENARFGNEPAVALHVLDDGTILALGGGYGIDRSIVGAFFTTYGRLDGSHGDRGLIRVPPIYANEFERFRLMPDGSILTLDADVAGGGRILRLRGDGTPDAAFGDGGLVSLDGYGRPNHTAFDVAGDGSILIASGATNTTRLVRLRQDGSLDASFGGDGRLEVAFDGYSSGVHLLPDGKFLLVGARRVARFNADGTPDAPFGTRGSYELRSQASASSVDGFGRLNVAGSAGGDVAFERIAVFDVRTTVPFHGKPFAANGRTIQAEDFDLGPAGEAHGDRERQNRGRGYRPGAVDIYPGAAGGFEVVAHGGEWLEYTIRLPKDGWYRMEFRVLPLNRAARVRIDYDGRRVLKGAPLAPAKGPLSRRTATANFLLLPKGVHRFRLTFLSPGSGPAARFDSFSLTNWQSAEPAPRAPRGANTPIPASTLATEERPDDDEDDLLLGRVAGSSRLV